MQDNTLIAVIELSLSAELGENIATAGLDLEQLPLGTLLRLGSSAAVELTGLRTPCILIERFQVGLKREVILSGKSGRPFRCAVLGVVNAGGRLASGDLARVSPPDVPQRGLPPL